MFQILTLKELNRGNVIEAMPFYLGYTFRPLVELLRMEHCPQRYNYHTRYVHYDLPGDVVKRLEPLIYIESPEELNTAFETSGKWFRQLVDEIDMEEVRRKLNECRE